MTHLSDQQISELYDSGSLRLTQERNDFLLPQILDFVERDQWVNLTPEYQRRLVWDKRKKSLFIESLLMNVPVPPIFLYEYDLNRYEVMDGQQRLNAILEFYRDELVLSGLTKWSALNGRKRSECPAVIRRGLDRRRVSATVLIPESQGQQEAPFDVRREVFERLNTGGLGLNAQELRHALYPGWFNRTLIALSADRAFREMWQIPHAGRALAEAPLFKRMHDCELVLRFFTFRDSQRIKGSVRSMLDRMMQEGQSLSEIESKELAEIFRSRVALAREVFGVDAFMLHEASGKSKLSAPLYDALMVALDKLWDHRASLKGRKASVRAKLREVLARPKVYELVVGRANTAKALKQRIDVVSSTLSRSLE